MNGSIVSQNIEAVQAVTVRTAVQHEGIAGSVVDCDPLDDLEWEDMSDLTPRRTSTTYNASVVAKKTES